MLKPVSMVHLRVQVPSKDAAAATRCIAREGLLHLVDLAHGRVPGLAPPAGSEELLASFRDLARRVRQTAERLGAPLRETSGGIGEAEVASYAGERELVQERLARIQRPTDDAWRGRRDATERAARQRDLGGRVSLLRDAGLDPARVAKLRALELGIGVARAEDLERLAALVAPAPFTLVPLAKEGTAWVFAAATPSSARDRLDAALRVVACPRITLPSRPEDWDAASIARAIEEADCAAARHADDLARLAVEAAANLADLSARAETAVLLLQAQTQFATSGRFTVISGWVPAAESQHLTDALAAATERHAIVDVERPEEMTEVAAEHLRVPILFQNPLLLRPFQNLMRMYDTPSYREVEPTAFFALSFLIMFGLMFGDVGHGAVLFAAGFFLLRRFPRFLDYGILLMEGGAASALFGVAYGSVFGVEHLFPALWLRPLDDIARFMAVTAGLGVVLVSGGLLLNAVNSWRAGERASALVGKSGLLGAFLYWVALAMIARVALPRPWTVPTWAIVVLAGGAVALIAARPLLVRVLAPHTRSSHAHASGEDGPLWLTALVSSVEVVDTLFSFFTSTLSFVRVAAFAAVHAGILIALFALTDTLGRMRHGGNVAVVLTLVIGNALIILLEGLTVSVQVLRLEYYEFFTRFFRGGGEAYRPLMLRAAAPNAEKGGHHGGETKGGPRGGGSAGGPAAGAARPVGASVG
jgi:V/A-type H+-transporting ATPase subunit I